MQVELEELQGNVLSAYGFPQGAHLFCRIDDASAAKRWLAALADRVTSAQTWSAAPSETLNVAVSFTGLRARGMPAADLARLPVEFSSGMAARAGRLRDAGADAPGHWQPGLDDRSAHLLVGVHVAEGDPAALADALGSLAVPPGVTLLRTEPTRLLERGREHFGYGDGLAQPAIADAVAGPRHGHGTPLGGRRRPFGDWPAIAPGEFVLGYPDEDGEIPSGPPPLHRNASYMVVRKLQQHVAAWERQLLRWAGGDPVLAKRLGAQVVGRW